METYFVSLSRIWGFSGSYEFAIFWDGDRQILPHAGFLFGWFSNLKMEEISSSETLVHILTTRHYIPENGNIHILFNCWFTVYCLFSISESVIIQSDVDPHRQIVIVLILMKPAIHCRRANLTRIYHSNLCQWYCSTSHRQWASHCFTETAHQPSCNPILV
jgi:hypothetical protein